MGLQNLGHGVKIGSNELSDLTIARMAWLLPAITVPMAMLVHILSGNFRTFPIFISEADHPGLERWIFTIGFCCAGLIQMFFAYRMWHSMRHIGRRKLMHITFICGPTLSHIRRCSRFQVSNFHFTIYENGGTYSVSGGTLQYYFAIL